MSSNEAGSYPRRVAHGDAEFEFRLMTPADDALALAFAQRVSPHDLLFLRRDISQPRVVAAWMEATRTGAITTLLAIKDGAMVACATVVRDVLSWSRHVGEMRVIVEGSMRGKGLGQQLTQECFALALGMGIEKMTAQMTVDQRGAINVFEGLGFRAEALLKDQVMDRDGKKHDIVILSHDVEKCQAQMTAYGFGTAHG